MAFGTTATAKPATFTAAMKHFFGFKDGQTLTQFSAEVKQLSPDDRIYFANGLIADGYPLKLSAVNDIKI